jgi:hypothetical protein
MPSTAGRKESTEKEQKTERNVTTEMTDILNCAEEMQSVRHKI